MHLCETNVFFESLFFQIVHLLLRARWTVKILYPCYNKTTGDHTSKVFRGMGTFFDMIIDIDVDFFRVFCKYSGVDEYQCVALLEQQLPCATADLLS